MELGNKTVSGTARQALCGMEEKISFLELEKAKRGDLVVLPAPMPLFHLALTRDQGDRDDRAKTGRDVEPGHTQPFSNLELREAM